MKRLKGRTALITGGGRGIGAATALMLAKAGVSVSVVARNEEQVVDVAARLRKKGHEAFAFPCDVTSARDVREVALAAREAMGRVDILVNGATTGGSGPLAKVTLDEWHHILAVNVTGTFLFTRALLTDMVEAGWGRVVNVASLAGLRGLRNAAAYTAAEHAVLGFTRAAAAEVAGTGVTVNAVCPGYVNTPLTQEMVARIVEHTGRSYADALETVLHQTGQYRLIPPTEVADAIMHLCRQDSADVNGEAIAMDGGGLDI